MMPDTVEAVHPARPERRPVLAGIDPLLVAAIVLPLLGLFEIRTCVKLVLVDQADLVGEEYNVVYGLERLIGEGVLYTDPARLPFAAIQYNPLYYWIARGLAAIARRAGRRRGLGLTQLLRGISFASLLAQVALVMVILRRHLGAAWRVAVVAGVALLIFQPPRGVAAAGFGSRSRLVVASTLLRLEAARAGSSPGPSGFLAHLRSGLRRPRDPGQAERLRGGPDRLAARPRCPGLAE